MEARWEILCAAAIACFSFSGALIMRMPREDRRTLFIFPTFLSVVVGGSLVAFGYQKFNFWLITGAVIVPIAIVHIIPRAVPGWLLTLLSYVMLLAAVVCADLLLESSAFG